METNWLGLSTNGGKVGVTLRGILTVISKGMTMESLLTFDQRASVQHCGADSVIPPYPFLLMHTKFTFHKQI